MDVLTSDLLIDFSRNHTPIHVIDIETTGFSLTDDEIVEIAITSASDGETQSTLVKPSRKSANATTHVTGISDDDLVDAPPIGQALTWLSQFVDFNHDIFIAHNGDRFDFPRINLNLTESRVSRSGITADRQIDSLYVARQVVPWGSVVSHNLQTLMHYCGIDAVQDHRAGSDTEHTLSVLLSIIDDAASDERAYHDVNDLIMRSRDSYKPNRDDKSLRQMLKQIETFKDTADPTMLNYVIDQYKMKLKSTYGRKVN